MTTPDTLNLSDEDHAGIAGTLHAPTPAAVQSFAQWKATQRPTTAHAEAARRQYSGDRITSNLMRAAEAVNARRRFVLSDEQMADVEARRAEGQSWAAIANSYHVAHTTLMVAYERQMRARRRAGGEVNR